VDTWFYLCSDPLLQLGKLLALLARLGVEVDGPIVVVEPDEISPARRQVAADGNVDFEGRNDVHQDQML
jgi:hypothetical protein